jgi:hypothetical protein
MRSSDAAEMSFPNPCTILINRPIGALKLILDPKQVGPRTLDIEFAHGDLLFFPDHCYDPHFDLVVLLERRYSLYSVSNQVIELC